MLTVVKCDSQARFDQLEVEWRALESQIPDVLPFQTFVWNHAWWNVFRRRHLGRRDCLHILAFYDGARLVGVLPMFETGLGVGRWLLVRHLRPFGADPNLTEIRTPLVLPEFLDSVLDHALELLQGRTGPSALHLIADADALAQARTRHPAALRVGGRRVPGYLLPLEGDWTRFRAGLKRNIKESLRRCYNSLSRENLRHDMLVYTRADDILRQIPVFYRLHASRAAVSFSSVDHPDYFATARHQQFLQSLVAGMNRDGNRCVHLFCLRIEHEVVAMRLAFRMADRMYLYYSGYQVAYGRFSVMTTLLAEVLRWSMERGVRSAHLSIGNDVSKTRWGPEESWFEEAHFVRDGTCTSRVAAAMLRARTGLRKQIRQLSTLVRPG